MRRFTSMKVGLAGILSCLALLFGLFTTTSTASAHTANDLHPNINVFDVSRFGNCLDFRIEGNGFTPFHHADLTARSFNGDVSIDPDRVRVNGNGEFATDAQVCGLSFGEFSNCGDFIDSPDFFCGVNLNPQEFCPLSEFDSEPFCLNLSALRPIKPVSQQDKCPNPILCLPSGGSQGGGSPSQLDQPPFQPPSQPDQPMPPPDRHPHSGSPCEMNPELCNQQGQPPDQHPHGGSPCEMNLELCNPQSQSQVQPPQDQHHGDQPPCPELQPECNPFQHHGQPPCLEFQPECHPHHFRPPFFFHFHRVRVFEFCRFHFFSFCHFRFRHRTITIFIRAFDEFTGRHSNTAEISFG